MDARKQAFQEDPRLKVSSSEPGDYSAVIAFFDRPARTKRQRPRGVARIIGLGFWALLLWLFVALLNQAYQKDQQVLAASLRPASDAAAETGAVPAQPAKPLAPAAEAAPTLEQPLPTPEPASSGAPSPVEPPKESPRVTELAISPAPNGNFFAAGEINGQQVMFIIDTGATTVSIPDQLRWKLNLTRGRYVRSMTANGTAGMYETEVKKLSIGPIRLRNVKAHLNPNGPAEVVLLGMSALREVRMVQEGGQLVLQQTVSDAEEKDAPPSPGDNPKFRKSVKDCMGTDKVIDAKVLKCMQGE